MNYGFFRAAACSLKLSVADPSYNKEQIKYAIDCAVKEKAGLLVTPELSVTGYSCGDLFFTSSLQDSAFYALRDIVSYTEGKNIVVLVGMPIPYRNSLYNCAVLINDGAVVGVVPKINLPNYNEFYEKRWFAKGDEIIAQSIELFGDMVPFGSSVFDLGNGVMLGVEICEDLWTTIPPSSYLSQSGALIIANLSASDEYVSKEQYRLDLIKNQSARCMGAYVYAGASVYESTTDLVFGGATYIAENGSVLIKGKRFGRENTIIYADIDIQKLQIERRKNTSFVNKNENIQFISCPVVKEDNDLKYRSVDPYPFVPSDDSLRSERCEEIFETQANALAKRLEHVGSKGCVIGISGGLDSTLALLVASKALKIIGKSNADILGVTMPGFGTTDRTYNNAVQLMNEMGVSVQEINIKEACLLHMKDIGHDPNIKDITYENTQARERTQILFDLANKNKMLLVGTGDLSEAAMGWCTYNGDHMSMYGVNASVPKTLVRYLVRFAADESEEGVSKFLYDILDTPVSPELLPPDKDGKIVQKTEDHIGPYELHDFFLYHFVRFGFSKEKILFLASKAFCGVYDCQTIEKWLSVFLKRFFISQFKRSCTPDAPKVGSVSLSPRGDWKMPSDASFESYLKEK